MTERLSISPLTPEPISGDNSNGVCVLAGDVNGETSSSECQAYEASVQHRCRQILGYYESEAQSPKHETARWIVHQLKEGEREVAARCSYAYWYLATRTKPQQTLDPTKTRFATALREAIRHTDCSDDRHEVLRLIRATIDHHTTQKTSLYRTCMTESNENETTIADVFLRQQRRDRIHDEMVHYQANIVRGRDREDRAIFFAFSRKSSGDVSGEQAFVDSILYTLERALAASEFQSCGKQDELFVVLDTKGGSCPPFKTLQNAVGVMQKYYPGRLKGCFILNAPYILTGIWKVLKPFLDPVTAQKFVFPSSKAAKQNDMISERIHESQAMPVLMPGKGRLAPSVSVERFLYEVPFHELYDCQLYNDFPKPQRSPTESSTSTASLSLTDSSSFDSNHSSSKFSSPRFRFQGSSLFRSSRLSRKARDRLVSVSVRSLAIGKIELKDKEVSSEVTALHR